MGPGCWLRQRVSGMGANPLVLAFAEHVVTNAARLWIELDLVQKQRLQQTLFPEGLRFDGEKFGTAATSFAFLQLQEDSAAQSGLASPTGFEPVF